MMGSMYTSWIIMIIFTTNNFMKTETSKVGVMMRNIVTFKTNGKQVWNNYYLGEGTLILLRKVRY